MKSRRTFFAPIVVALAALATGGWLLQRGAGAQQNIYTNARVFNEVMGHVSSSFVDPKDEGDLYRMAIDGMLQELGDPHTGFMAADEYEDLRIQTQGEYGGLGITISQRAGWITVITPLPGTPGERAGLRAGDQIVEVEGESTRGWTEDEAVARLRGPKGSPVNIKIARLGADQPIPLRVVRDEIHLKAVPTTYMIAPDIGYVELTVFSESSTDEVRAAVNQLRSQGAKGIVLDMRSNSGGLLDQGVAVTDLFLERGDAVVETRGRVQDQNHKISAYSADQYPGMPMTVLVSERSASATEIVAGALQDHDRALLIGRTTFGKGSVQTVYRLSNDNWLKLTTARWYTPSGRSIQRPYGIDAPHDELTLGDAETDASAADAPTYRTDGGRTVYGGGGIRPDLVIDPDTLTRQERQLVTALQDNLSTYMETKFAFGVAYNEAHPELKPGFAVTPAILDDFYRALTNAGVVVERETYDDASRWVSYQLGYEMTYSRWGVAEARKWENRTDAQVQIALDLLRRSTDPQSLFAAADSYRARRAAGGVPGSQR